VGAAVVLLLTAASCSGLASDPSDEKTPRGPETLDYAVSDARAVAPAVHVDGALRGGTINVVSGRAPESLDPTRASSDQARSILSLVVRSLTQFQYRDGRAVLVPDLATDLGKPNKNFTTWTFRLRDGIRYEDGTEVTSEHVAHAIRRQMATEELPDGFELGSQYYLDGETYRGPWESGENFRGVSTPDDKTIVVRFRRPFPEFPFYAATPAFSPIPPDRDKKRSYVSGLLATGPYKFEKYVPGNRLVLTLNEQWDPATDTTRQQYVDRWIFTFGQSTRTAQHEVATKGDDEESGTIVADPLSAEVYEKIEQAGGADRVVKGPARCVTAAYLDTREIPLPVRKAVATAWPIGPDREAAGEVKDVTWSPATSLLPSGTPGRLDYEPVGAKGALDGDPEAARRLLGKAGKLGFELSYYYDANDEAAVAANEVREEALRQAGFEVQAIEADDPEAASADPEAPVNVRFHTTCPIWPSGGAVFPLDWTQAPAASADESGTDEADTGSDGENDVETATGNLAFFEEPGVVERIEQISRLPVERGMVEWGKLDKELMQRYVPAVPLGEVRSTAVVGDAIGNAQIDPVTGMPIYTTMYLKE